MAVLLILVIVAFALLNPSFPNTLMVTGVFICVVAASATMSATALMVTGMVLVVDAKPSLVVMVISAPPL